MTSHRGFDLAGRALPVASGLGRAVARSLRAAGAAVAAADRDAAGAAELGGAGARALATGVAPDELVGTAMLSDGAAMVSGQVLAVDDGRLAG